MEFSAQQLITGIDSPNILALKSFKRNDTHEDSKNNTYEIETELIDDSYFWFCADFGKALPWSKNVYDKDERKTCLNPRKSNQVELNNQLFCLYEFESKILYISNMKKKSFLEEYMKVVLEQEITVKNYYIDADSFIDKIKTISSINLRSKKHLFSKDNGIFTEAENIFGLGNPADVSINVKYNKAEKTNFFVQMFKNLREKVDEKEIDSLTCIGKDDQDFEAIFNVGSFTQKMSLNIKKDVQGMYNPDEVKAMIIAKLRLTNV